MLRYSFSTVLMTIVASNLLVILLTFCFRNTKLMINAGYKLLALFILFTVLRFVLPFEFPFRIRVFWPEFISLLVWKLFPPFGEVAGQPVSLWTIFKWIWILGICINLIRYVISYIKSRRHIILNAKVITSNTFYTGLLDQICQAQNRPNKFTLIELPDIKAPVLYGIFKPCILIPEKLELSEQDWYYVLQHEASHHFHHDLLMKNMIKLITIVYWWNPFCILLNRQTDVILEMRVDDTLTLKNPETTGDYLQCLINVSENINRPKNISKSFTMSLLPKEISDMGKRFRMLIANQKKRNLSLNIILFTIAFAIYILSYLFIVEAFHTPEEIDFNLNPTYDSMILPAESETYAILNENGTYDIYFEGAYLDTLDSIEYYYGITVYTEEDFPK